MNRGGTAVESRAGSLDRPLSFRANVSWSFFGTLAHAGSRWLGLVVLARLGGAETVGTLALATAIASPIFALTNLQLRQIQAVDASGRFSFSTVFGLRLLTSGLALLGVGLYAVLASRGSDLAPVLLFVALAQGFESLSEVIYGRLQRRERLDRVAQSMTAHGVLGIVALAAGYAATGELAVGAAGMAAGSLATFLFFDLPSLRAASGGKIGLQPRFPRAELVPLLRSALPLGGTMMLVSLNGQIPRYFLEGSAGRAELGIFAALWQLVAVGNLVVSAVATAASPRLANAAHAGDRAAFRSLSTKLYGLIGIVSGGGILLSLLGGELILLLVFGPDFAARADVLVLLAIAGSVGFACAVPGHGLTATGAHGVQLPLFCLITAVSVGLCAWLIPAFGLRGAAIAILGTYLVQFFASNLVLGARLRRLGS